jgi:hypothetical protein
MDCHLAALVKKSGRSSKIKCCARCTRQVVAEKDQIEVLTALVLIGMETGVTVKRAA